MNQELNQFSSLEKSESKHLLLLFCWFFLFVFFSQRQTRHESEEIQYAAIHQMLQSHHQLHTLTFLCCQIIPRLFTEEKRKQSESSVLQLSRTVKWNRTKTLGVCCVCLTLLSLLFLNTSWDSFFFCKYPMQLRCKESAGMLSV